MFSLGSYSSSLFTGVLSSFAGPVARTIVSSSAAFAYSSYSPLLIATAYALSRITMSIIHVICNAGRSAWNEMDHHCACRFDRSLEEQRGISEVRNLNPTGQNVDEAEDSGSE